jgi:hypothetical protein
MWVSIRCFTLGSGRSSADVIAIKRKKENRNFIALSPTLRARRNGTRKLQPRFPLNGPDKCLRSGRLIEQFWECPQWPDRIPPSRNLNYEDSTLLGSFWAFVSGRAVLAGMGD